MVNDLQDGSRLLFHLRIHFMAIPYCVPNFVHFDHGLLHGMLAKKVMSSFGLQPSFSTSSDSRSLLDGLPRTVKTPNLLQFLPPCPTLQLTIKRL